MENNVRITQIWRHEGGTRMEIPLFTAGVSAGFPSPADDFVDRSLDLNEFLIKHPAATYFVKVLDLNEFLIKHPAATYFVKVEGTSMIGSGIHPGDILIVDRAIEPSDSSIVIAVLNGEFLVKRFRRDSNGCRLLPENPSYKAIELKEGMHLEVWGVVTYVIHKA